MRLHLVKVRIPWFKQALTIQPSFINSNYEFILSAKQQISSIKAYHIIAVIKSFIHVVAFSYLFHYCTDMMVKFPLTGLK